MVTQISKFKMPFKLSKDVALPSFISSLARFRRGQA